MIESADGLTRYIAVVDEREILFEKPTKVLEVMRKRGLSPFNAERAAAEAERIRQ